MSLKSLPNENFALPKNAIPLYPIPKNSPVASLNKIQGNREDDLPVQPISDNDTDGTWINSNPPSCHGPTTTLSKPMCSLLTDCIEPMYANEGPLENTTGYDILEMKKGFNYFILLGELMYAYITCQPDIRYVVTTLCHTLDLEY